jgi:hypothetical protein
MWSRAMTAQWDFESEPNGLKLPQPHARIVETEPRGHALRIDTDRPHHTVTAIADSEQYPDLLISLRVKLVDWTGTPPVIYIYGRQSGGGFRGLQFDNDGCGILCWRGRTERNVRFGKAGLKLDRQTGWVNLTFACAGNLVAAKCWPADTAEPGWQIEGLEPGQPNGWAGFGVWTHPAKPSTATVLFDDVRCRSLNREELAQFGLATEPRPALDDEAIPQQDTTFETGNYIGLRCGPAAVAFDRRTGDLAHILDLQSKQEFVSPQLRTPLFELVLTRPATGERQIVNARDFRTVTVSRAGPAALRLRFAAHIALPLTVTVDATAGTQGKTRLRHGVTGLGEWCLAESAFPQAPAPAALDGDGAGDRMLLPWQAGGLLPAPGQTHARREVDYPGVAVAQFTTMYSQRAGVYWAAEDAGGHPKRLSLNCTAGSMASITFKHLFPEQPGTDARTPYDVVLTTFHGDWMDAADIYRDWARQQPWCRQTLRDRDDIPQFLKQGAGIIIAGIQNPEGRTRLFGENFEKLPDILDAYRDATGLKHLVFVPYGWENRGTWAGINYFPAIPSDDCWRAVNRTLRERDHRTAFLTSGFWWVVRRQKTGSGPAFDDTEDFNARKSMCIHNTDGTVWSVDNYSRVREHGSWRGWSAALCHGSDEAAATMKEIFLRAAGLGVPLVSFDQEIGGAQVAPCYAPHHGHPPGYGAWMWTSFRDLCEAILAEGRPIQPELGLFTENVSELAIPVMATYWSRQFGEVDVAAAGDRGVGLFSYLYHDYVTAIGAACVQGQGRLGTRPGALLRCRVLANNLVRGLIPGPFMHDVPLTGGDAWRQTVSRAYRAFCRPYAAFPEYLLLGRRVRPPDVECGKTPTFFYRQSAAGEPLRPGGVPVVKVDLDLETVVAGAFEAHDGSVAAIVVNATPDPQETTLSFRDEAGRRAFTASREPRNDVRVIGSRAQVRLDPFEVLVLVSDPERPPGRK